MAKNLSEPVYRLRPKNRANKGRLRMISDEPAIGYAPPSGARKSNVGNSTLEQWLFDEASGSIVGEVNTTTLTASGTPVYNDTLAPPYNDVSPGIDFNASGQFSKAGADSNLDFGAGRTMYVKAYVRKEGTARYTVYNTFTSAGFLFEFLDTTSGRDLFVYVDDNSNNIESEINAMSTDLVDGNVHEVVVKAIPGGALTIAVDSTIEVNAPAGMANINALVPCNEIEVGHFGGTRILNGRLYELHISEDV